MFSAITLGYSTLKKLQKGHCFLPKYTCGLFTASTPPFYYLLHIPLERKSMSSVTRLFSAKERQHQTGCKVALAILRTSQPCVHHNLVYKVDMISGWQIHCRRPNFTGLSTPYPSFSILSVPGVVCVEYVHAKRPVDSPDSTVCQTG